MSPTANMATSAPTATASKELLSNRILQMEESATIAMAKKGRELATKGHDVINLSFGEPDFGTPQHIREAAKQAIDEGWSHYTPVPGYPELRRAVADKFLRENGLKYSPEQIVVSTGAKQCIANVVLSSVNEGDEVLILAPYWVSYLEVVKLAGGVPIIVSGRFESNFKPSIAAIEAAITPSTKLIMYSSPSNPTGGVFSKADLVALAAMLRNYPDVLVMADEIYEHLNYVGGHHSLAAEDGMIDRVITINGLSKAFAMTGWRVGYMGAPLHIAKACDKMQGQFTSGTCSIAQRAAITALNASLAPTLEMTRRFGIRRKAMFEAMSAIPGLKVQEPDGAFYLFPDVTYYLGKRAPDGSTIATATDLCIYLLETAFVSLVSGEAFGDPDCIRISFAAADEKLAEAVERIKTALAKLS